MFCPKDEYELNYCSMVSLGLKGCVCATVLLGYFPCFLICTWQCELRLSRRSLRSLTDLGDFFTAVATLPSIYVCLGDGIGEK